MNTTARFPENTTPSPATGRPLQVAGEEILIRLPAAATGAAFTLLEEKTPAGGGPPPHVHRDQDEAFLVLEGDYEFLVGDERVRAGQGASVWGPRGVPHGFRNVGNTAARMLVVISPGGFERFFEQVDELARAGVTPTPDQLVALGAGFGLEFLPPAAA